MLATQDSNSDLNYILWNGSAWGSTTELTTNTGETKNQPFLFLWNAPPASPPVPVATDDSASTFGERRGHRRRARQRHRSRRRSAVDPVGDAGQRRDRVNNGTEVTYTPNVSFLGVDTFTYVVSDGDDGTDTATVTVTVGSRSCGRSSRGQRNGYSGTTATINAVDPTKTFLTFTVGGGAPSPSSMTITGELTNATTLTFARVGTTGPLTIEWSGSSPPRVSGGVGSRHSAPRRPRPDLLGSSVPVVRADDSRGAALIQIDDFPRAHITSPTNRRLDRRFELGIVVSGR